jgi:hypothetical protein
MEDMVFVVTFHSGKVLIFLEKYSPYSAMIVRFRERNLYKLQGKTILALVHDNENLCELWHKRLRHLHYRALLILRGIVTSLS